MRVSLVLALLLLSFTGCTSKESAPPTILSQVTAFGTLETYNPGKSVAVIGFPEETNSSLQFKSFIPLIEHELREVGLSIKDPDNADYIAFVSYGIDTGETQTQIVSEPVYGAIGGGTTYHSGTVSSATGGYASYNGSSYSMPTFGVVGTNTSSYSYEVYTRQLAIDIVERPSLEMNAPVKVYEGRLTSKGTCANLSKIMHTLLRAMFTKFPNGSGTIELGMCYYGRDCSC